jgi:hypothetical protein
MRVQVLFALLLVTLLGYAYANDMAANDMSTTEADTATDMMTPEEEEALERELEGMEGLGEDGDDMMEEPAPLTEEEIKELKAWEGHMKPLGHANEKIKVQEINAFPTPKDFYTQYVLKSEPVVIRGGAVDQQAKSKWSDAYLQSSAKADQLRVYVEDGRKENRTNSGVELPDLPFLADYVTSYATADKFMITDVLPALKADLALPQSLQCSLLKPLFMRALVYLNGGDTKSVLHHEHYEDLHCVLEGKKTYTLANPATNQEHIYIDADDAEAGEYVAVDVDAVDAVKYPGIRKVVFYTAEVNAGDCIYLPSTWMQADQTASGRNLATSLWWAREDDVDDKVAAGECKAEGAWSLDQLAFHDEVATLMVTDEERKTFVDAKPEEDDFDHDLEAEEPHLKDEL